MRAPSWGGGGGIKDYAYKFDGNDCVRKLNGDEGGFFFRFLYVWLV